ncbi:MAG: F0F1 ATP synthase subunit A [Spirochaetales bacterium]|jgi:F-type H+-transporting ATPase subunit a|nr:F0F1 ATP synthase subunit A [Spirochaetales bacterium]
MEALEIKVVFSFSLFGHTIPVTETVVVSWLVMAILIVFSFFAARHLRRRPSGPQALLETAIGFLNTFSREKFGAKSKYLGHYIGSLFLFLLVSNIIAVISPLSFFGFEPLFTIKPPTRDINVSAPLALVSIALVLVCGFRAKGVGAWFRRLVYPMPLMLPFNIMEYGIRPLSLCLRLFGNILGAFVLMQMIEKLLPIGLPVIFSLYFDFLDGLIQAAVFVFLTSLYIAEAMEAPSSEEAAE